MLGRRLTVSTIIGVAVLGLVVTYGQDFQIEVKPPPRPDLVTWPELWSVTCDNKMGRDVDVVLKGYLFHQNNLVARGTAANTVKVPAGISDIRSNRITSIKDGFYAKDYEGLAVRGKLPAGTWLACMVGREAGSNQLLDSNCVRFEVRPTGEIRLLSPKNEAVLPEGQENPLFTWLAPSPMPPGKLTYELAVVDVLRMQTGITAMKDNKPVFKKTGIPTTNFKYTGTPFEVGKKYAWQVKAMAGRQSIGASEVFTLSAQAGRQPEEKKKVDTLDVGLGQDGTLVINGGPGADRLLIRLSTDKLKLEVDNLANGVSVDYSFEFAQVHKLKVRTGAGDDWVIVADTRGKPGIPLDIDVGDGENFVLGSTGTMTDDQVENPEDLVQFFAECLDGVPDLIDQTVGLVEGFARVAANNGRTLMNKGDLFRQDVLGLLVDSLAPALLGLQGEVAPPFDTAVVRGDVLKQVDTCFLPAVAEWRQNAEVALSEFFDKDSADFDFGLSANAVACTLLADQDNTNDYKEADFDIYDVAFEDQIIPDFTNDADQLQDALGMGIRQLDSCRMYLEQRLDTIGDTLLAWSDRQFFGGPETGPKTSLMEGRAPLARIPGQDFQNAIDMLDPGPDEDTLVAGDVEDGANSVDLTDCDNGDNGLLGCILCKLSELGLLDLGTGSCPDQGCDFQTTNLIAGSGVFIGGPDNDEITATGSGVHLLLGLGGNDRMRGGSGTDVMCGGSCSDDMYGRGGIDVMFGNGGNDCMYGGDDGMSLGDDIDLMFGNAGDDVMHGNKGRTFSFPIFLLQVEVELGDIMFGNDGDDEIHGDQGIDLVFGNGGADDLYGEDCSDWMWGNSDNDVMDGGPGKGIKIDGVAIPIGNFMFGNTADDTMTGGDDYDFMWGNTGNDSLNGGAGMDFVWGNQDNDVTHGDGGTDFVWGNAGDDKVFGDAGIDFVWGNRGKDSIHGGAEVDVIWGNEDDDVMYGDAGMNFMWGNKGVDEMHGGPDVDVMWGNKGDDKMFGGAGVDFMWGNKGKDQMSGEAGPVNFVWGNQDDDKMLGGPDVDVMWGNKGKDEIHGGAGTDFLWGNQGNDQIYGEGDMDFVWGNQGDDKLWGFTGTDFMWGNQGNDLLSGWEGMDFMCGNQGNDVILGEHEIDFIFGNDGNDEIHGGDHMDFLFGNQCNDQVYGDGGMDFVWGNEGDDKLWGSIDPDFMWGNAGDDCMDGSDGIDFMWGNEGADLMLGGFGDITGVFGNVMFGNAGNDRVVGGDNPDFLWGNEGDDKLWGGRDRDVMFGNAGKDDMYGGDNTDLMFGNGEDDRMFGGADVATDFMFGNSQADCMDGGPGTDFMFGNGEDDRMFGGEAKDFMFGNAGADCMDGDGGGDWMFGNAENDLMFGRDGNDWMFGGRNDDTLDGGPGNDKMFGGPDTDKGYGGPDFDWRWSFDTWDKGGSYSGLPCGSCGSPEPVPPPYFEVGVKECRPQVDQGASPTGASPTSNEPMAPSGK